MSWKVTKSGRVFMDGDLPLVLNKGTTYRIARSWITFYGVDDPILVKKIIYISNKFKHLERLDSVLVYDYITALLAYHDFSYSFGGFIWNSVMQAEREMYEFN
ncbi:hypothetical protein CPT_Muldoon_077 [Serratia phage Muldoon]|uniref:Uncharacterized protein n=1 Tax=Serratia phage Muldoon TaxID=2601678 RepID=A0A5P8PH71_9CAUD|nr:hypothetical protein HYP94_gp076 [Serratia phage Muldoon]QFR56033.1 hypothetical protein CPT_Muldoon_077 [Serratia phage Muldoon]